MTENTFVYVGNWDRFHAGNSGIGIFRFDEQNGKLTFLNSVAPDVISDTACLDHKRGILYYTDQHFTRPRGAMGSAGLIHAFRIDPETGDLTAINAQQSYGTLPAYIAVDATGEYLIVTHHTDRVAVNRVTKEGGKFHIGLAYDDATTVLFRLGRDGAIGEPVDIYTHDGHGGPLEKQTHPQLHCVVMPPSGSFFAVCDKGNDRIFMFRINREMDRLEVCGGKAFQSIAGSLPRYCVFHPTLPYLFVNHEEQPLVSTLRYDDEGLLTTVGVASAVPDEHKNAHVMQSDIRIDWAGRHLYSLIRGLNAVAVFAIDQGTGLIERIQLVQLEAAEPRGCAISPDGRFLLIAALKGQSVVVYAIEGDGKLRATGHKVTQSSPSNITFFRASR